MFDSYASATTKVYTGKRLAGLTRVGTSSEIAKEAFSGTVQNVVLATGYDFPDALAGSVLAKKLNAPILLAGYTPLDSASVITYITNHLDKNGTIYVLGGQGAVNSTITESIKLLGYSNIIRINGSNRYNTCYKINSQLNVAKGTPVVITTGNDYPDALSISSIASQNGYPIILSDKDSISDELMGMVQSINPSKIYIAGGVGVISNNVVTQLKASLAISDSNIVRIAGNDRYSTSLSIAKYFNLTGNTITIATGKDYPDALSGSVLSANLNAPILLVGDDATQQKSYIDSTNYTNEIIYGGIGAISSNAEHQLKGEQVTTPVVTPPVVGPPVVAPPNATYQPDIPTSTPTLEYMLTRSTEATTSYTINNKVDEALDDKKIPFDGNWYHWRVSQKIYSGGELVTEYFSKVLKEFTTADGKKYRDVYAIHFSNGVGIYPPRGGYYEIQMN